MCEPESVRQFADLPDGAAPEGVHVYVYRNLVHGLYSPDRLDRHMASGLITDSLRTRFRQDLWNELLKAVERFPCNEREELLSDMLTTGRDQGIDLQIQELRHPDAERRANALDMALGALGAHSDHSSLNMGWLERRCEQPPKGADPGRLALEYVERIEPFAQTAAADDPNPTVRDWAARLIQRCERVRHCVAKGLRIEGMQYPDGSAIVNPQDQ